MSLDGGKIGTSMVLEPKEETYVICARMQCLFCNKFKRIKRKNGHAAPALFCNAKCSRQYQSIKNREKECKKAFVNNIRKQMEEKELELSCERFNNLVIGDIPKY